MRLTPSSAIGRRASRPTGAFTLIELLVVIAIIALLAAVGLPALKGFGGSNAINAADRQLLDDIQFARQRAIAEHTGVFMIFASPYLAFQTPMPATAQVTNILTRQYSAYSMVSRRSVGDQPGYPQTNYLTSWRNLPDGIFIAERKFTYLYTQPIPTYANFPVYGFNRGVFPFPTRADVTNTLPYIAFNYLGQLSTDGTDFANRDEYIPLARGSIFYTGLIADPPLENPAGNSTNLYNLIHIDALTGRARVEQQEVK